MLLVGIRESTGQVHAVICRYCPRQERYQRLLWCLSMPHFDGHHGPEQEEIRDHPESVRAALFQAMARARFIDDPDQRAMAYQLHPSLWERTIGADQ